MPEARSRDYIERLSGLFESIGGWSYDHRWIVLTLCLGILGVSAALAARTRFDNSFEAFFDRADPAYAAYLQFREDFGSDEVSYIVYEAPDREHGPWDLEIMRKIQRLTDELERGVPFVREVTTLANVEFMEGVPDGIEIFKLLEEFPGDQAALLEIRSKVLAKPMLVGGLASADTRYAAIMIEMDRSSIDPLDEIRFDPEGGDGIENLYPQVTFAHLEEILGRPEFEGIRFHHTGDVPLNAIYNRIIVAESGTLGAITLGVVALLLILFFRRPIGVIGPLVVVALSVLIAVGFIGLTGWDLDFMFGMLPVLLIAVGVADSVHIISEFQAYHAKLGDRREAVRRTLYLVGTPCLLTSLTTAVGFGAMSIAPIKAISHLAIYSAVGVMAAFFLSITLLMVFLSLGRRRASPRQLDRERAHAKGSGLIQAALEGVSRFDVRFRRPILLCFALLFGVSALGVLRLRVDSNFLDDFSDQVPIKHATQFVDDTMGGTGSFIYLFDTGTPDRIKEPAVLRDIERLQERANGIDHLVKKTYSIVDILKDINQSFHEGDPAFYKLPETRALVAQYLLVYEMSGGEEVEEYVSSDYSRASLELRTKMVPTSEFAEMVGELRDYLAEEPIRSASLSETGIGALWMVLMDYIVESQIRGVLLAFTAIAAMLCFVFQSVRVGLFAMIPNISPVLLTIGAMGWLDVPLDYTRLMIATVAIGISVDDTIHHVTRFRLEFRRCGRYEEALYTSMREVGRALFITSVVLVAGFLVFLLSVMDAQASFGILLASTIGVALVADFLLMPALVLTFHPFGPEGTGQAQGGQLLGP